MAAGFLNICSFNCCSLKKNINLVRQLADEGNGIILLQETFIIEEKLGILDFIDEDYECVGVAATFSDKVLTSMSGRQEGGMALLWKKNSKFKINKLILENNVMLMNVNVYGRNVIFVNVYCNSDIWEATTLNKYLETLSVLQDFLDDFNYDSIYFIGDFNADPLSGRAWKNLTNFMNRNSLVCFDVDMLGADTITFTGYGNSSNRWLDHIVGKLHDDIKVNDIQILEEINGSDHLPLKVRLEFQGVITDIADEKTTEQKHSYVNWYKFDREELDDINTNVDIMIKNVRSGSLHNCNITGCRNINHLKDIDELYCLFVKSIEVATEKYRRKIVRANKFRIIPGWNRRVKELHRDARESYLRWVRSGRKIGTSIHESMLSTRKVFKTALNDCKIDERIEISNSIMHRFCNKSKANFLGRG